MDSVSGTYALVLRSGAGRKVAVEKLGTFRFKIMPNFDAFKEIAEVDIRRERV